MGLSVRSGSRIARRFEAIVELKSRVLRLEFIKRYIQFLSIISSWTLVHHASRTSCDYAVLFHFSVPTATSMGALDIRSRWYIKPRIGFGAISMFSPTFLLSHIFVLYNWANSEMLSATVSESCSQFNYRRRRQEMQAPQSPTWSSIPNPCRSTALCCTYPIPDVSVCRTAHLSITIKRSRVGYKHVKERVT